MHETYMDTFIRTTHPKGFCDGTSLTCSPIYITVLMALWGSPLFRIILLVGALNTSPRILHRSVLKLPFWFKQRVVSSQSYLHSSLQSQSLWRKTLEGCGYLNIPSAGKILTYQDKKYIMSETVTKTRSLYISEIEW